MSQVKPLDAWLQAALADVERRGLPGLKPLLEGLAISTRALRAANFVGDASGPARSDHLRQGYGGPPKLHAEAEDRALHQNDDRHV